MTTITVYPDAFVVQYPIAANTVTTIDLVQWDVVLRNLGAGTVWFNQGNIPAPTVNDPTAQRVNAGTRARIRLPRYVEDAMGYLVVCLVIG